MTAKINMTSSRPHPDRLWRTIILWSVLLFLPLISTAQDSLLTLEKAIEMALQNNYDVKLATNFRDQSSNSNTAGNAGMLPRIDLNGSYSKSNLNTQQNYSSGLEVNRDNVSSENSNLNVVLNWTLFDGMKMFTTKRKLEELSALGEKGLKLQMENSLVELIRAYYTVVRQQQILKTLGEELSLSEDRVNIAERRMNNGSGSRLNYLQAKTDFNTVKSAFLTSRSILEESRVSLNQLLARDLHTSFRVEDTVVISYIPRIEDLKSTVASRNSSLEMARINRHLTELGLKEIQSQRSPKISLTGNYLYSRAKNEVGFLLLNQNQGYNYGLSATVPLFAGFTINTQVKNARISLRSADLELELTKQTVNAELLNAFRSFQDNLELLKLEEENILIASEAFSVAQERFTVGVSSNLEMKDAQKTYEDAVTRLVNARFNAKISETALRQLNGDLLK